MWSINNVYNVGCVHQCTGKFFTVKPPGHNSHLVDPTGEVPIVLLGQPRPSGVNARCEDGPGYLNFVIYLRNLHPKSESTDNKNRSVGIC